MMIEISRDGGQTIEKMDEALLEKRTGTDIDHRALIEWVEYWLDGQLVHRSAHVDLTRRR